MTRSLNISFLVLFAALAVADLPAVDFTVRGTVTSQIFFYDELGNSRKNSDPIVREHAVRDFIFKRSDEKWRLDIVRPDSVFPEGAVWRSFIPMSEGGYVSIINFPPRTPDARDKGNAYVNIITNTIFPYDDDAANAVWLSLNLGELIKRFTFSDGCPPFWKFDPLRNDAAQRTHNIMYLNGGVMFWCNGQYLALDENQKPVFDHGQLRLARSPAPIDKGFPEGQYIPSAEYLDRDLGIPKAAKLTFWIPFRDQTDPAHARFVPATELVMSFNELNTNRNAPSVFEPTWTNTVAIVVDPRGHGPPGEPLSYVSRSNHLDFSQEELEKRQRKMAAMLRIGGSPKGASRGRNWPGIWLIVAGSFSILAFLLFSRRSKARFVA